MRKHDVIICTDCGLVLLQATDDIALGETEWATKLRAVQLPSVPGYGAVKEEMPCTGCGRLWWPEDLLKGHLAQHQAGIR